MQATEPTTASTNEAFDTEMKEVEARAGAKWSAGQALAEGDAQVNHQLRRLSLHGEASQVPMEEEDALLTPGEHLLMHWYSLRSCHTQDLGKAFWYVSCVFCGIMSWQLS